MDEALATEDFTLSDIGDGEQLIKELGEGLPQRIAYIGAEHRCRFVNQAFIRWCGRPREEVVGHLMSAVLGADAYQTLRPLVDQALAGVTIKHQVDVLKADGRHELREIVLVPHHGGGGAGLATRGCFWIASDTTPQLGEQQRQQQFERDRGAALELLASGADTDRVLDLLARAIESRFPGALVKVSMDGSSCPPTASAPPAGAGHLLSVPIVLGAERAVGTVWCRLPALPGDAPTDQHLAGVMTALQSCAQIAALAAARRELDRRLAYQAQHDDLTGLPNRLLFEEHVHLLLAAARRRPSRMALVVIDLDDFKRINDALGHAAGDQLLRMFSDRLARCTRGGDLLGRIAGDEFVILLRDLPPGANAHTIAARLCDRLHAPLTLGEHEVHLFASFGVSNFPEDGSDASTLLRKADIAMSRAKADGKKRVATFTPDLLIEASDRLTLEGALRRALDRHELSLHLQPQVDLRSRRVVSFEALCRWNHPRLGVVAPSKFIACAEETGLIIPLGTWVIGEACRQARALSQQGHPGVRMAVNVSAAQFLQGDLVDIVQRAVRECQLQPDQLEVELTESVLMRDVTLVADQLSALRSLGVRVAIDDFGTGYSSLAYLQRLPIDALKIDQSFIRPLAPESGQGAGELVRSIIQLAHSLRLGVVAEGVETAAQTSWLADAGCDVGQGYWLGRPAPLASFARIQPLAAEAVALIAAFG